LHSLAATAFVALLAPAASGELIDRILALVEGRLITLSDARGVLRMGLEPQPARPPGTDTIAVVLETLIDRQLILIEVDRYAPPEPPPATVERRVDALRARFPDALAFETALHEAGFRHDELRRYIRDSLRMDMYVQQRFTAAIQPREEELLQYYREHAPEFTRDGAPRPFESVRDEVRARFVANRQAALVREWLEGLRRRANVMKLYLPQ
jgi:hypothetical protein